MLESNWLTDKGVRSFLGKHMAKAVPARFWLLYMSISHHQTVYFKSPSSQQEQKTKPQNCITPNCQKQMNIKCIIILYLLKHIL